MVFLWGSLSAMFGKTLATFGLPPPVEAFRVGPDGAMPGQLGHAREGIRAGAGRAAGGRVVVFGRTQPGRRGIVILLDMGFRVLPPKFPRPDHDKRETNERQENRRIANPRCYRLIPSFKCGI
jgi:hypothetical protein